MNSTKKTYSIFQKATAVFLILTLLWLTGSTPFVMTAQAQLSKQQKATTVNVSVNDDSSDDGGSDSNNNNNNVEEKTPGSINFSEEFLHEHESDNYFISLVATTYPIENSDTYIAFHGELHAPPPNMA